MNTTPITTAARLEVALVAGSLLLLNSCLQPPPDYPLGDGPPPIPGPPPVEGIAPSPAEPTTPQPTPPSQSHPSGSHAAFAASSSYPKTMRSWSDDSLLPQLTKNNSTLIICLPQQRARLYIKGQVAMDWPVSTGTNGHLTPTGVFRVMEKKEKHHSSRYGRFVSASGKVINRNADLKKGLPAGAKFAAASMPYWHRFTWDGVGLHTGVVKAGQRLSHGCIRTPNAIAKKFFQYSQKDMPVYITRNVEDFSRGGEVDPIDVKYRPIPNNDYTDNL